MMNLIVHRMLCRYQKQIIKTKIKCKHIFIFKLSLIKHWYKIDLRALWAISMTKSTADNIEKLP